MRNIHGGRSKPCENELASGVSDSLEELEKQAEQLGADAVIEVDIDYESVGSNMLMISASGTAYPGRSCQAFRSEEGSFRSAFAVRRSPSCPMRHFSMWQGGESRSAM